MGFRPSCVVALAVCGLGLGSTTVSAGDVVGVVRDQGSMAPIGGAMVTLQATAFRTTTAADGSYLLTVPDGTGLVVVAAKKGYYNRSIVATAPSVGQDFLLEPVPQDDDPNYAMVPPQACGSCHPDQLAEWNGSPMSKAGVNTWVDDIYSGLGTPGGMGGFVYLRDSVFAATNPASECASCHQPEPWLANPFSPLEDPRDPRTLGALHGISCEVCHKFADIDVTKINFPGVFPGAATITRPAGNAPHQVQYGVLGDVDFESTQQMRASYQPQLLAEVCGACHQDKNDPDENHTYTGITSEPTYLEWLNSPYSDINSPQYANCVDCHMPPTGATEACVVLSPPLVRDPNTIRSHNIEGTTPYYLENAVEMSVVTQVVGGQLDVEVSVTNSLTGHHVPTGVTVRNMILLVEAWRDGDDPVLAPLDYTGTNVIHDLGGLGDPAQGYYAGLPGRLYAKLIHDANLNAPTFFTDATGIVFDNRIPALASDTTQYSFDLPLTGGLIHVRSRLIYRRAFRFLVDAKQWSQDGHGNPLADVLPPNYGHLMEISEETISVAPTGGACCVSGSCLLATEADCTAQGGAFLGLASTCDSPDADGDGVRDECDGCPQDANKTSPQVCGCGVVETGDSDGDQVLDCVDSCAGVDDAVFGPCGDAIPTTSEWGLLVLALLLLVGGKIRFSNRTAY